MSRSGSATSEGGHDADAQYARDSAILTAAAARERDDIREDARATDAARREEMTESGADRRAEVPRTRVDALNPNKGRKFPSPNAVRQNLSSNMKKDLNRLKRSTLASIPNTRFMKLSRVVGNRQVLGRVNERLHDVVGLRSEMRPAERRTVGEIDNSIADFEAQNEREHIVYATLAAPKKHGNSRNALRSRLEAMASRDDDSPEQTYVTFDGYIPASHTLGQVPDSDEIVMEVRTRSGMYMGTSDTRPEADHLVGRGRDLRPRAVREVPFVRSDGTQGRRWIVQMDDVTPDTTPAPE